MAKVFHIQQSITWRQCGCEWVMQTFSTLVVSGNQVSKNTLSNVIHNNSHTQYNPATPLIWMSLRFKGKFITVSANNRLVPFLFTWLVTGFLLSWLAYSVHSPVYVFLCHSLMQPSPSPHSLPHSPKRAHLLHSLTFSTLWLTLALYLSSSSVLVEGDLIVIVHCYSWPHGMVLEFFILRKGHQSPPHTSRD